MKSVSESDSIHVTEKNVDTKKAVALHSQEITGVPFVLIVIGLIISIFLAAMDNTIVSTALTKITSEFHALNQVTWVATSYLLTVTALEPLYGKLSDIFGRRTTMLFALGVFLLGSVLCGASNGIIMLIISRAIAGLGGGGLVTLSVIIVSDIVPLQKRGLYLGIVGGCLGVASVVGPLIGGAFTDRVSWRWNFYINLPIGGAAVVMILFFLKLPENPQNFKAKLARIDYLGTFTLVTFIILGVLGLNWGGNDYPWNSTPVIVSLVLSGVFLILFVIVEFKYAVEPIVPKEILNRNVISAAVTAFFNLAAFFGAIIYIPIYYQVVKGESAIDSGLELIPLILGMVSGSISSGIFTSNTGYYRICSRVGSGLGIVGVSLLGGFFRMKISHGEIIGFLFMMGLGIGLCIQTNTIVAQASVHPDHAALATAFTNFCQAMGGVIGLAILGAINQNILVDYLTTHLPPGLDLKQFTSSSAPSGTVDPAILTIVQAGYIQGLKYIFLSSIALFGASFLSALFLKHIPLDRSSTTADEKPNITNEDIASKV